MKFRSIIAYVLISIAVCFGGATLVYAGSSGGIDPNNNGQHYARFLENPGIDVAANDLRINFGRFTTQPEKNIHISDDGLTGYAWGALSGWIVMNCVDTPSGCSATNGNFKVSVTSEGLLQGYAWGENTGWINFGPFTNSDISRVQIDNKGFFDGSTAYAGYAWSEQFGWILFDCDGTTDSCVRTDYRAQGDRPSQIGGGGSFTQCGDNIDNDLDGLIDMQDESCGNGNTSERPYEAPVPGVIGVTNPTDQDMPQDGPIKPIRNPSRAPSQNTGEGIVIPSPEDTENMESPFAGFETIVPTIIDSISNKTVTTVAIPHTRDVLVDSLRNLFAIVKSVIATISSVTQELFQSAIGKTWAVSASVVGIISLVLVALVLLTIVPIAGGAELFLFPQFLLQNIRVVLGVVPIVKPWGVVYDTKTYQPLPLMHIALKDPSGGVVATTVTHADGSFSFGTASGEYTVALNSTTATPLNIDAAAQPLFGPVYTGAPITVSEYAPNQTLSIGVQSNSPVQVTKLQSFVVRHEATLTTIALGFFGAGLLAAIVSAIFYPSSTTVGVVVLYGVALILRGAGVIGSYASVFVNKVTGEPLAGELIQVYDTATKQEVARTLTSRFGRGYITVPRGYYYATISNPALVGQSGASVKTAPFVAHGGLHRARFTV